MALAEFVIDVVIYLKTVGPIRNVIIVVKIAMKLIDVTEKSTIQPKKQYYVRFVVKMGTSQKIVIE